MSHLSHQYCYEDNMLWRSSAFVIDVLLAAVFYKRTHVLPGSVPGVIWWSHHSLEGSMQPLKLYDKVLSELKVIVWQDLTAAL